MDFWTPIKAALWHWQKKNSKLTTAVSWPSQTHQKKKKKGGVGGNMNKVNIKSLTFRVHDFMELQRKKLYVMVIIPVTAISE